MAVRIKILRDIQLREGGHVFTQGRSRIEYDAKRPWAKKRHALIYQQGEQYGAVGDCCEYLTHDQLRKLEAAGAIQPYKTYRPAYLKDLQHKFRP